MKYVMIVICEYWVESEYGTIEETVCFESDLSMDELKSAVFENVDYNDSHYNKKTFLGCVFTNKKPYDGYVNFELLETLEEWFEGKKLKNNN